MIFGFFYNFSIGKSFYVKFDIGLVFLTIGGIFGWLLQVAYAKAIKLDNPSSVLLIANSNIILALFGDYYFFGSEITKFKFLGSVILLGALFCLTKVKDSG